MAIEEKSLKKILDGILKTDMIVEEGSGTTVPTLGPTTAVNWEWKKYSNGTVECWGSTIATYNLSSTYGGEYYLGIQWPVPSGLFIEIPQHGQISRFNGQGDGGLITASLYNVSTTSLQIYIFNPVSYNNTIGLSVYLVGKWATVDPSSSTLNITGFSQNQMSKQEIQTLIEASGNIFVDNTNWVPSDLQ